MAFTTASQPRVQDPLGDSMDAARVVAVIPSFRVSRQLAAVIASVPAAVSDIVVVDDACPDSSGDVAEAAGDPRVRVIRHPENRGVGGAMKTGFRAALEIGADVVVKIDGDGQMDPSRIPELIRPLLAREAAYAKGNRFWHLPSLSRMPPLRRVGNLGLSFLAKVASGHWQILDPANGYVAIRGDVLRILDPDRISDDYFFELSMLIELGTWGFRVVEVSMPSQYGEEESSLSVGRTLWTFPVQLLRRAVGRIWYRHFWYDFTVAALFLAAGIPLFGWGLCFGLYSWWVSISTNIPATSGTVMLSALPLLLGVTFLLQALGYEVSGNFNSRVSVDPEPPSVAEP